MSEHDQVLNETGEHVDVAIIGYGTAGVNAAIALRNAGFESDVHVFSDTETPPYSPILTSYFAGGEKTYEQFFPWSAEELACLRLTVHEKCPVTELDPAAHLIRTPHGSFVYRKCLIASGASPATFGFPATEGYEPLVLRTLDDGLRLKEALERPACTRVLVSGASMVAAKALEACLNRGVKATLVGMNPHVLDYNALPETAMRFERGLREKGVELRLGQTIADVRRRGCAAGADAADAGAVGADAEAGSAGDASDTQPSRVLEVTFSNGDVDTFDEIIVAHGVRSNLSFVANDALEIDRALLVDEFMRTSDPDVYAAGDVAQALELVSGQRRVVGIWKTAAVQGACAGAAMAAELAGCAPDPSCAYKGAIPANTIAVNGTLFISAGTVEMNPARRVEIRETEDMTVAYVFERAGTSAGASEGANADASTSASQHASSEQPACPERLVGFNITCDHDKAGSVAYDTGAMLTLRIEAAHRR